jgi:hypothetical protein
MSWRSGDPPTAPQPYGHTLSTPDAARFRRGFIWTVGVLGVLCATFAVLGYAQPPKLTGAAFDAASSVARADAQLRITANQALAPLRESDVTVTPAAAFSTSIEAGMITVGFDQPLRYGTDYKVVVTARALQSGVPAEFTRSIRTPAPPLFYLDRAGSEDRIIRTNLAGTTSEVLFKASSITDYVIAGSLVVAVTDTPDGTSDITLISTVDGATEALRTPVPGVVDQLDGSAASTRVGFRLTGKGTQGVLMLADLGRGRQAVPVAGPTGSPLAAIRWAFVHDGLELVAENPAGDIVISDVITRHAQLLAQRAQLDDIATDGQSVRALVAGGEQTFQLNGAFTTITAAGGRPGAGGAFVRTSPRQALRTSTLDAEGPTLRADGHAIYTAAAGEEIIELSATPNDQYAVVEVAPVGRASERGAGRTVLVDVAGGGASDVPGVMLRW